MRTPTSICVLALAIVAPILGPACGEGGPSGPDPVATATVTGFVTSPTGAGVAGASVSIGGASATTNAVGQYRLEDQPVGGATIVTSAPGYASRSDDISLVAGLNDHGVVLTPLIATLSGVVTADTGGVVAGALVKVGSATTTTGADGRFDLGNLRVGTATLVTSAPGFAQTSASISLVEGENGRDVELMATGIWGTRAPLLANNSELAFAEVNGKIYLMGGYPPSRVTQRTVQVYDIASNSWSFGPLLPQPNNHGMAATVDGRLYLIGGQMLADDPPGTNSYVSTVYEFDPEVGEWVSKAPMPTARSAGVAVVLDGKIYVAGGRPPREQDFAVYDPATNEWQVLPNLPTPRNHFTGAAIDGRIHYVGGRQGLGLGVGMVTVHEVFDPATGTWTTAAPMLRARSGMNGVMARGCFHVWGGEGPEGMFPDHDIYDPCTDEWRPLSPMPIPVHGVYGSAFVDGLIRVAGGGVGVGGSMGSTHNQVFAPAVRCE